MDAQNSNTTVCCMCGDIGFPDKLFRCTKCCHRFQHSYCSNYYDESTVLTSAAARLCCDWCLSEDKAKPAAGVSSKNKYSSPGRKEIAAIRNNRSSDDQQYYSGENIKQNDNKTEAASSTDKGNNMGGSAPSPKTPGRRYKLLKDVMC